MCKSPKPLLVTRTFVGPLLANWVTVAKSTLPVDIEASGKFGFAMYAAMSDTVSLIVVSLSERKPLVCGLPICVLTGSLLNRS